MGRLLVSGNAVARSDGSDSPNAVAGRSLDESGYRRSEPQERGQQPQVVEGTAGQSRRIASIGSIAAARCAGSQQAISATPSRTTVTAASAIGS